MHQIPPRKILLKSSHSSTLRVSVSGVHLGAKGVLRIWASCQRSLFSLLPPLLSFIKAEVTFLFYFILFFVASSMTYNYVKGQALCTAKGMHMLKQQLAAVFASGVGNNTQWS